MKMQYVISTLSVIPILVVLYASSLVAQKEPKQEKNQVKSEIKTILQNKEQVKLQTAEEIKLQKKQQTKLQNKEQTQLLSKVHINGFVDADGDGFNDNAFDDDGDGIPNGQDPDFVRPQDGSGQKFMKGKKSQSKFGGNKYGPRDGTGNQGIRPKDGSGFGSKSGSGNGTGTCDGTGPHGTRGGR